MLDDPERKLLRILNNFISKHRCTPRIGDLRTMTGRHKYQIKRSLNILKEKEYIVWDGTSTSSIILFKAWEDHSTPPIPLSDIPYGRVNRCVTTHGMSKDKTLKKYGEPKSLRIDGNVYKKNMAMMKCVTLNQFRT
jgi:hypothetical protein